MPVTPIWAHLVGVCEPREGLLLWSVRVAFVFGVFACLRQYFKTFLNRRKRLPSKENPFRTPGWRSVLCIRRFNVDLFAVIVVVCADLHYTQCPMIYGCRGFFGGTRAYWIMASARRVQQRICSFFGGGGGQPAKLLFRKLGQGFSDEIANESELCIVQLPVFFRLYFGGRTKNDELHRLGFNTNHLEYAREMELQQEGLWRTSGRQTDAEKRAKDTAVVLHHSRSWEYVGLHCR